MSEQSKKIVDARGTFCPGPLMELIAQMKQSQVGDLVEVWSTDAGSAADIPEWINKVGHEYISSVEEKGVWRVLVRKIK